jgi:hypothetical protein
MCHGPASKQQNLTLDQNRYTIQQILSMTLFEKEPLSSTFKYQLHKPGGQCQQPIESIQLTLGQL